VSNPGISASARYGTARRIGRSSRAAWRRSERPCATHTANAVPAMAPGLVKGPKLGIPPSQSAPSTAFHSLSLPLPVLSSREN
jgi:hypothetical protein